MIVKSPLQLSLLTLGSLSAVLGLRERPSDELTRSGVCEAKCEQPNGFFTYRVIQECEDKCLSDQQNVPLLDSEAGSNVTYVCDAKRGLGFHNDPGVFIFERRNQSSDWYDCGTASGSSAGIIYFGEHLPAGRYQYRLTRALATGIARPETTKWYIVSKPDAELLTHPLDMWIECLELDNGSYSYYSTVSVQLGFRFADEYFSCFYKLRCESDDGKYNETIQNSFLDSRKPTFRGLPLGGNFTISMQPIEHGFFDDQALVKFSTPSHWPNVARFKICVPDETEALNAAVTPNKVGNTFDVALTWKRPEYIPDFFIVNITLNEAELNGSSKTFHNVSGSDTGTVFRGVTILDQFNVSIRAWSWLGGGPESSRLFPIRVDSSGSGTLLISGILVWVSLMVTTGVSSCA